MADLNFQVRDFGELSTLSIANRGWRGKKLLRALQAMKVPLWNSHSVGLPFSRALLSHMSEARKRFQEGCRARVCAGAAQEPPACPFS